MIEDTATPTPSDTPTMTPTLVFTPTHVPIIEDTETPTLSATPTPSENTNNCTYPINTWKSESETWPTTQLTFGGFEYSKDEVLIILNMPPEEDVTYIVAQQLITTILNILNGAADSDIIKTKDSADSWLSNNHLGGNPPDPTRSEGLQLSLALSDFNNGISGPGLCK
jgi:hypothetical protein